jgi:hypothetical protein
VIASGLALWRARSNRWGSLRLTTTGRRTDQERSVILGYLEDGPNLITRTGLDREQTKISVDYPMPPPRFWPGMTGWSSGDQ